jgi:hypothetical protein
MRINIKQEKIQELGKEIRQAIQLSINGLVQNMKSQMFVITVKMLVILNGQISHRSIVEKERTG